MICKNCGAELGNSRRLDQRSNPIPKYFCAECNTYYHQPRGSERLRGFPNDSRDSLATSAINMQRRFRGTRVRRQFRNGELPRIPMNEFTDRNKKFSFINQTTKQRITVGYKNYNEYNFNDLIQTNPAFGVASNVPPECSYNFDYDLEIGKMSISHVFSFMPSRYDFNTADFLLNFIKDHFDYNSITKIPLTEIYQKNISNIILLKAWGEHNIMKIPKKETVLPQRLIEYLNRERKNNVSLSFSIFSKVKGQSVKDLADMLDVSMIRNGVGFDLSTKLKPIYRKE